jgi:two-component system NtrC family response regulator
MQKLNILIVEDGQSQREMLRDFLNGEGHHISEAEDGEQALGLVRDNYYDLVLLDYKMPKMDGMAVLEALKGLNPDIDAVMMTAYGTIDTAVRAMKAGALDYITKPIELEELLILIDRISERRTLLRENELLREQLRGKEITSDQIIYRSRAMEEVMNIAGRVSESRATVLIQGESGTGKELIAKLIHHLSPRSEQPMMIVNCAALPENLMESELFGHEKGAFTGAEHRRIGRFEEAHTGTLFLDEIGELSPSVQVKLLRFLQDREFQRVGGNQTLKSDVRIISATNKDLEEKVKEGEFREDLYYRLNVVAISIPPLRDRKEDLPPLMDHFLRKFAEENGKDIQGFSPEARDLLLKYNYPGNARELENIMERAVVVTRENVISTRDLPFEKAPPADSLSGKAGGTTLKESMEMLEKRMIMEALEETSDHQTRAAALLGISERMLRYKIKKYHLKG